MIHFLASPVLFWITFSLVAVLFLVRILIPPYYTRGFWQAGSPFRNWWDERKVRKIG